MMSVKVSNISKIENADYCCTITGIKQKWSYKLNAKNINLTEKSGEL